jgi:excisionase family DNA binding protein
MLTVQEVADKKGVNHSTVLRWIYAEEIEAEKVGKRYFIPADQFGEDTEERVQDWHQKLAELANLSTDAPALHRLGIDGIGRTDQIITKLAGDWLETRAEIVKRAKDRGDKWDTEAVVYRELLDQYERRTAQLREALGARRHYELMLDGSRAIERRAAELEREVGVEFDSDMERRRARKKKT